VLGVVAALAAVEAQYAPALTIVEGAGGLWVPMPGGTWQPAWISGLAATPVVVGRLGLGTINHCLLTIAALRSLGLPPCGFILTQNVVGSDLSYQHNEQVIAAASMLPCLGVLLSGQVPRSTAGCGPRRGRCWRDRHARWGKALARGAASAWPLLA
jgi:dethiobiotin synthetase